MKGRTYRFFTGKPLYAFGYGLSYSTFAYSKLAVKKVAGGRLTVSVTVKNTSQAAGDEVAQVYMGSADETPWLKAFKRVHLSPGEKRRISWKLEPDDIHGNIVTVAGAQPRDGKGVTRTFSTH
jgi:beta-glucosidase